MSITKGEREIVNYLAENGGFPLEKVEQYANSEDLDEKNGEECLQVLGYYQGVKAAMDASFRTAWEDNIKGGTAGEGSSEADLIDALWRHGGYPAEWLEQVTNEGDSEQKAASKISRAEGYKKAIAAMSAAGFRAEWVDNRSAHLDVQPHGYMVREKKM